MMLEIVEGANLTMRPFEKQDGPAVYAYWLSDPDWEKFNDSIPTGFTEQDACKFVEELCARDKELRPSWALIHNDTVVGVITLSFEADHESALLGYGVHGDLRGRGLVAESVTTILDSAFHEYPQLTKIQARTHPDNTASIRVLTKLGFSPALAEELTFELLRANWNNERES